MPTREGADPIGDQEVAQYDDPLSSEDRARSEFSRRLIQHPRDLPPDVEISLGGPPKRIVQFWDNLDRLPHDVSDCMKSWKKLEPSGFEIHVFDETAARNFIRERLGTRHEAAFDRCYHPSMKSDYFRYSYVYTEGGFYIDADDVYLGGSIEHLFEDGRLKLQPFCYDIPSGKMVPPSDFIVPGAGSSDWIFYFNTTPLIAARRHPMVGRALMNATKSLEQCSTEELPEVQATTGPGNLTKSVLEVLADGQPAEEQFLLAREWEKFSISRWPLGYRGDKRNWRLSNQQPYKSPNRTADE